MFLKIEQCSLKKHTELDSKETIKGKLTYDIRNLVIYSAFRSCLITFCQMLNMYFWLQGLENSHPLFPNTLFIEKSTAEYFIFDCYCALVASSELDHVKTGGKLLIKDLIKLHNEAWRYKLYQDLINLFLILITYPLKVVSVWHIT